MAAEGEQLSMDFSNRIAEHVKLY